jgi:hypothetical protein
MEPSPGQFFAVHAEKDTIAEGIQLGEKIQAKRKHTWKGQKLWNHIGCIVEKDGILCVGESLPEGFKIHSWVGSRYQLNDIEYCLLELYKPFSEKELFAFTKLILSIEGVPYDFTGIIDQTDFVTTGDWEGEVGLKAQERMYCSEAIATEINKIRKGIFAFPWLVNPQMFFENPNIIKSKIQTFKSK